MNVAKSQVVTSLPESRQVSIDEVTSLGASSTQAAASSGVLNFHASETTSSQKSGSPIIGIGTGILTGAGLTMNSNEERLSEDGSVALAKKDAISDDDNEKQNPVAIAGGSKAANDAKKKKEKDAKKDEEDSGEAEDAVESVGKWFTWEFWHLMVICALTLLIFSEVIGPLAFRFMGHTFLLAAGIFFLQMVTFMLVAILIHDPKAAGAKHTLSLSTILAALSFLILLFAVHLRVAGMNDQIKHLVNDMSYVFRPLSSFIVVFLVVEGVLEESKSDWGNLVLLGSFVALGLAFGLSGMVKDIMCYFLIRMKNIFDEEDFIYHNGEIYQVRSIGWLFIQAYRMSTRSITFIPNSEIGSQGVNNQSRDDKRVHEATLPLPGSLPAAKVEAIIKEGWNVLRGQENSTFLALNGQTIDSQMDTKKSSLYITNINETSGNEFASVHLNLRLVAKYYYSKPPPWEGATQEPIPKKRQLDWKMKWHYQVEWFLVEMKKLVDKHS
jgi:small-conductance mechanosensitive channel